MDSVKYFGFILIALTIFGRGNALLCSICKDKSCGNVNTTIIAECSHGTVAISTSEISAYYPDLKVEPSNKFSCFKVELTIKEKDKDEVKQIYKGCSYANTEICKQGKPKVETITEFTCSECSSDRCNSASALTQSALFITISFLLMLLSQKM